MSCRTTFKATDDLQVVSDAAIAIHLLQRSVADAHSRPPAQIRRAVCAGNNRSQEAMLKGRNAVETGCVRKAFDISELVEGSIGIDGEHPNGSGPRLEVEQVFAISADGHVKVVYTVRK
jgi:hypothetical protein